MRAYKKPTAEAILTRQIRDYFKWQGIWHYKAWQGLGSLPGVSDVVAVYKGIAIFVEIKAPKGKLSVAQIEFLRNANEAGAIGIVLRSADDMVAFVEGLKNGKDLQYLRERFQS